MSSATPTRGALAKRPRRRPRAETTSTSTPRRRFVPKHARTKAPAWRSAVLGVSWQKEKMGDTCGMSLNTVSVVGVPAAAAARASLTCVEINQCVGFSVER